MSGDLEEGLSFVALSQAAYPNDARQKQLREQLVTRRAWLDRRLAVLGALAEGPTLGRAAVGLSTV